MLLVGCASNSGVVPMGNDTYMVSRKGAAGFTDVGTLNAEVLQEGGQYCSSLGKEIEVISTERTKPPYILGNFPQAEVQFRCVSIESDEQDK